MTRAEREAALSQDIRYADEMAEMAVRMRMRYKPEWQPIDAAPKGVFVLTMIIGAICPSIARKIGEEWWGPDFERDPYAERATHWMPLPEPPKE